MSESDSLRDVVAKNIADLRSARHITQLQLAEVLHYSDKAISKWERGESIPDVAVLKTVADYFGVTVDYLLTENHTEEQCKRKEVARAVRRRRASIAALAFMSVWLIATVLFAVATSLSVEVFRPWLIFIYAVPVSTVVLLVFNSLWGRTRVNYLLISALLWALLTALYLTLLVIAGSHYWLLFILGVPGEIIILLWSGLSDGQKR